MKTNCGADKPSCHKRVPHSAPADDIHLAPALGAFAPAREFARLVFERPPLSAISIWMCEPPDSFLQSLQWHAFAASGRAL